jgi:hypothetical protein
MNGKPFAALAVAATLFVTLSVAGDGNARRREISTTRRVVVDGRPLVPDDPPPDGSPPLEREFRRLGVRLPDGFSLPGETGPSHPAFEGRLKDSPPRSVEPARLPAGMTAEHSLRMEGEETQVDLVFGKLDATGPSTRNRLASSGWRSVSTGNGIGGTHVLHITQGKETSIACLDEAEGTFLLFREVDR